MRKTAFQTWLLTFIEEKCIDMSEPLSGHEDQFLQVGDVIQAIYNAPKVEQDQIKKTLVIHDYQNISPIHFLRHLAKTPGLQRAQFYD